MPNKVQKFVIIFLTLAIVVALMILAVLVVNRMEKDPAGETSGEAASGLDSQDPPYTEENDPTGGKEESYLIDMTPYRQAIHTKDASFLILVNAENNIGTYLPNNIVDSLSQNNYSFSSYQIHETALMALTAMCLEAQAAGVYGIDITSAYRSYGKQNTLFYTYCDREKQKNPSLTQEEAEAIVSTYSCRPGTSEHQTGLAVDLRLKGDDRTLLEESFADTEAGKWLAENCHRFGFVLRFPKGKTEITGIQFEPWHFRFVGYDAANEMKKKGMCLEEYSAYLDALTD